MESKLSPIDSIITVDKQKLRFHFYLKKTQIQRLLVRNIVSFLFSLL